MNIGDNVICINDNFSNDVLAIWLKYNIKHPVENKIYTIREIIKHSSYENRNMIGVRLVEINNSTVPTVLGLEIEPTFSTTRFTTLLGEPLIIEKEVYEEVR
jgi:hypothetical protein